MKVGDLLELLYAAHDSFTTVHAVYRYWWDPAKMNEMAVRRGRPGSSMDIAGRKSHDATDHERLPSGSFEIRWRAWMQRPDQWRFDYVDLQGGSVTTAIHRDLFWHQTFSDDLYLSGEFATGDAATGPMKFDQELADPERASSQHVFLDPSPLLGFLKFDIRGFDRLHGRDVLIVHGEPRWRKYASVDPSFWENAESVHLWVDRERGILHRYAALADGKLYATASSELIVLDEPIPDEIFLPDIESAKRLYSVEWL